ncbi:MAG: aminoglycoside phosphotransferase family protein [Chloroflexota bacterium]
MAEKSVSIDQAQIFLTQHFSGDASEVTYVGEGAWSRCFGFRLAGQDLVIRFGKHVDDFQKDQLACAFSSPILPIPEVSEVGEAFDCYYAISTRVYGTPLEDLNAAQWQSVVPSLVLALEAMRTADLSSTSGVGGWGVDRSAPYDTWSEHLLAVDKDTPDHRTYGWRDRLATSVEDMDTFTWGFGLLKNLVTDDVPRSLLHCDLINRNVLVDENGLAGIFDWGCALYGDHLYDLAWFEFWAPWYPELDIAHLRSSLEQQWQNASYNPPNVESRLRACHLHIGLDHLAYNAYTGNWDALRATAAQMKRLVR